MESLKGIIQENSLFAKKFLLFGNLGFLYIHACAMNVNLEFLENFYFGPWLVLENSWNLHIRILHEVPSKLMSVPSQTR